MPGLWQKVSDRLDSCPKCGCPFSEELKESAVDVEKIKLNESKT